MPNWAKQVQNIKRKEYTSIFYFSLTFLRPRKGKGWYYLDNDNWDNFK